MSYPDLREWLVRAEDPGELRVFLQAHSDLVIGGITEVVMNPRRPAPPRPCPRSAPQPGSQGAPRAVAGEIPDPPACARHGGPRRPRHGTRRPRKRSGPAQVSVPAVA